VVRVGSKDTPVGFAKSLESAILLTVDDIEQAILSTVNF
jgi:pyruvate/2-oxoglutarate/acetoin dehydrogenase E1 component